jgi:hypothetical protein
MQSVFDFAWTVPNRGFRLENGHLVLDDNMFYHARRYFPLRDEPALFRTFVALEPTAEMFLAFANRYGWLGVNAFGHVPDVPSRHLEQETVGSGIYTAEMISRWAHEHSTLSESVAMWQCIEDRDAVEIEKQLGWNGSQWICNPGQFGYVVESIPGIEFRVDDIFTPAAIQLQGSVNVRLKLMASPAIIYDPSAGQQILRIIPTNLLGAMWLQLANAITGHKEYRSCVECGTWFEVSKDGRGGTKRKVFCDTACKVRDYRRKKALTSEAYSEVNKLTPAQPGTKLKTRMASSPFSAVVKKQQSKKRKGRKDAD